MGATSVVRVAQQLYVCGEVDSKGASLGATQIGYLSIHIDVSLPAQHPRATEFEGMRAELQIRTLGQHLWSEMAHDAVYKNGDAFAKLSDSLRRRVNLMAGVIEVADMEFDRLNGELEERPEVQVYRFLEGHYYKLTAHSPTPSLSLEVISLLLPLYQGAAFPTIRARVGAYVASNEHILHEIYALQEGNPTAELIFQPEALMIAELLDHDDQTALRTAWSTRFPESELERLAVAFGHSFD